MKLLKTKPYKQSRMMCGPASLKIVAEYYGIYKSEKELALYCRASRNTGTTGKGLLAGARAIGLSGKIVDGTDFKTIAAWLHKGVPVIVDWFSPGQSRPVSKNRMADGHYAVVIGLTPTHIILEDPGPGERRKIGRRDFMRVWFDFDTDYLTNKANLVLRRLIIIAPKKFLS